MPLYVCHLVMLQLYNKPWYFMYLFHTGIAMNPTVNIALTDYCKGASILHVLWGFKFCHNLIVGHVPPLLQQLCTGPLTTRSCDGSLLDPVHLPQSILSIHSLYQGVPSLVNTLRPRQNGRHFPEDIFKCIFLNENVWISLKISLKFVPMVRINNIPALVQIMAWHRPGGKPLSEPMMVC